MKSTIFAVTAGAALALVGCSRSDFNTPTKLNKVRILAIQAEPPQPALGASTTLRALVYQPPPADGGTAEPLTYSWSWCPLATSSANGFACPIDQATADQLFAGIPGVPPLDLGSDETASFTNPFPSALLASLCAGNTGAIPALAAATQPDSGQTTNTSSVFGCQIAGFPITVTLVVHAPPPTGDLPAVFNVFLPVNDNIAPNTNPVAGDIKVTVNDADYVLDQAGTQGITFNAKWPVGVDLAPSNSANSEPVPDPNDVLPNPDPNEPAYVSWYTEHFTTEELSLNWYAECGNFSGEFGGKATSYIPGNAQQTFDVATHNSWDIPKSDSCPGAYLDRIVVVVTDGRGGVGWVSGVVHLGDTNSIDAGATDVAADSSEPGPDAGAVDSEEADGEATPETSP